MASARMTSPAELTRMCNSDGRTDQPPVAAVLEALYSEVFLHPDVAALFFFLFPFDASC